MSDKSYGHRPLSIPLESEEQQNEKVIIFADELPIEDMDYNDVTDLLTSVIAPIKIWRTCAVSMNINCAQGSRSLITFPLFVNKTKIG